MKNTQDDIAAFIAGLAEQLGEADPVVQERIARIVRGKGAAWCMEVFAEARAVEDNGGLMTRDGTQRRTFGGVWFFIVKQRMTTKERAELVPYTGPRTPAAAATPAPAPTFAWKDRGPLLDEARETIGEVTTVKITIIGRPNKMLVRDGFTVAMLEHNGALPSLPKGLPIPQKPTPTRYAVYIGAKQWRKVADALKAPDDLLIAEGIPLWDERYQVISVFVTNATTKGLQRAQREQHQAT